MSNASSGTKAGGKARAGRRKRQLPQAPLRRILSTKVQVRALNDGRGEILIEYYSADDLERILELFHEIEGR
jgi:hypothetical protein